jgi:hypothetical protein
MIEQPFASSTPLAPGEAEVRFDRLQRRLVPLWKSIETLNQDPQTIVVVPSMSLDTTMSTAKMQAYEERFLFLLFLLRQPRAHLIYVTGLPIHPSIIDYYLALVPGVIPSHARPRLHLLSPLDGSSRPLSQKLLSRPAFLERIRSLIRDPERAHLIPYNTTESERDLALALGIPMYGADPRHFPLGTKTGCRRIFAEVGVPHPAGIEGLRDIAEVAAAILELRAGRPDMASLLVKLNEGVSGEGNALVDLKGLPAPGAAGERQAVEERLRAMRYEAAGATYDGYVAKLAARGGVIEERITGDQFESPSVQLRATPLGRVELLSTHDQLLGGPSGQSYLGCRFPADPAYAPAISREAFKVGEYLAKEGVIGRFALDFVAVRSSGGPWRTYAIEVNLRKGGTTHPFLTLQFLTDGTYDADRAVFTAPSGRTKCFVASDHVESPSYCALGVDELFDLVTRHGLHFDQSRQTGVVFHMMSAMAESGSVGMTAVGDTPEQAQAIYARATEAIDAEAKAALAPRALPVV